MLTKYFAALMITGFLLVGFVAQAEEPKTTLPDGKWKLVFQDEFTGTDEELDKSWGFENRAHKKRVFGRWRENATLSNGILKMNAKKESRGGKPWTAASLWTQRRFKYGYFECRYKYCKATGTNNSFWIMTRGILKGDPGRFEIDINGCPSQ